MAFLTYDLADFQHRVRGFYFELADEAPGPLVETTAELIEVLRDLEGTRASHAERYARFRKRYCHLEDGGATQRVLERLGRQV
jgi:CDP-glycerol glycerophosphotransferase